METRFVVFVIIVLYLHSENVAGCELLGTKLPYYGYHCVSDSRTNVDLHRSAYPQCVWRCLTKKTCRFVNHNSATDECQLGLGNCKFLRIDVGFMAVAFG